MMFHSLSRYASLLLLALVCVTGMCLPREVLSQELQGLRVILKASEVIPKEWISGPNYTIKETIINDGVANRYELDTKYGPVMVDSTVLLLKRIHELMALNRMDQLQGTDIFLNAAKGAAIAPLSTAKGLVQDPVGTVSAIGSGVGRFFSRVGDAATSGDDPYQPGAAKSVLGQASSKRAFAYEFGVDPYSPYQPLQKALDSIAWTAASGSLTVKAAFAAIPGGAGAAVSLTGTADSLRSLVRDKTPAELQAINAASLLKMGIPDSLAKVFLNNFTYDPQEQTLLVGELANMKTRGKDLFIVAACSANQESMAVYMRVMAQLIAIYNQKFGTAERFVDIDGLPFLQKTDGTVVGIFPVDYVSWTQRFAQKEMAVSAAIMKMPNVKGKELWIAGAVTPTARKALEAKGWKIEERFGEALLREMVAKGMAK